MMEPYYTMKEGITPGKKRDAGFFRVFFFTLAIALLVRFFIAQPFVVSGSSMEPTFYNGDYLIIDEISYRLNTPDRGDVIVFRFPENPSKFFIKRIIGLPGETIELAGGVITVEKEGAERMILSEPYLFQKTSGDVRIALDDNEYFVMGDNRGVSSDSRVWGPVSENLITGRVLVQLFPLSRISLFPGNVSQ